jgi:hypothetical protein
MPPPTPVSTKLRKVSRYAVCILHSSMYVSGLFTPTSISIPFLFLSSLRTESPLCVPRLVYLGTGTTLARLIDWPITMFTLVSRQNAPTIMAPPGITPNYINPVTQGDRILVYAPLLGALSLLFVGLRLVIKLRILKTWALDDSEWKFPATHVMEIAMYLGISDLTARHVSLHPHRSRFRPRTRWDECPHRRRLHGRATHLGSSTD